MTADQQIKVWAAYRLGTEVSLIERVEFVHEDERWYSEITMDPAYDAASVEFVDGHFDTIHLHDDFGDLIREILVAR